MNIFNPFFRKKSDDAENDDTIIDGRRALSRPMSARISFKNSDMKKPDVSGSNSSTAEFRGPQIAAARGIRVDTSFNSEKYSSQPQRPVQTSSQTSRSSTVPLAKQTVSIKQTKQENVFFGQGFDADGESDSRTNNRAPIPKKIGRNSVPDFILNAPVNNPVVAAAVASSAKPKPVSPSATLARPASAMLSPSSGIANLFNNQKSKQVLQGAVFPIIKQSMSISPESSPSNSPKLPSPMMKKRSPTVLDAIKRQAEVAQVKPVVIQVPVPTPTKNRIINIGPSAHKGMSEKEVKMTKKKKSAPMPPVTPIKQLNDNSPKQAEFNSSQKGLPLTRPRSPKPTVDTASKPTHVNLSPRSLAVRQIPSRVPSESKPMFDTKTDFYDDDDDDDDEYLYDLVDEEEEEEEEGPSVSLSSEIKRPVTDFRSADGLAKSQKKMPSAKSNSKTIKAVSVTKTTRRSTPPTGPTAAAPAKLMTKDDLKLRARQFAQQMKPKRI